MWIRDKETAADVGYALVMTPEVRAWLHSLRHRDRPSAILVARPSACGLPEVMKPDHRYRVGAERLAAALHVVGELPRGMLRVAVAALDVPEDERVRRMSGSAMDPPLPGGAPPGCEANSQ